MSVRAKFCPFAKIGSPEALARAYAKQSPKLSAAGWRPFPKLRRAERAISICSASTEQFPGLFGPQKGRTRAQRIRRVWSPAQFQFQEHWQPRSGAFQLEESSPEIPGARARPEKSPAELKCRLPSARHPVLVVPKNFVRRPIIKRWQRIDTPQKIFYLPGQNPIATARLQPLPALLERFLNGFGDGLPGLACYLPGKALGSCVFDAERHPCIIAGNTSI